MAPANLTGFNAPDYGDMQSYEAIPAGDYLAIAVDSEMKPTKSGTGAYLQITFEVLEGEYKGRKLWSRLNLQNSNQQAVEIAQRELATICRAVGVLQPRDSSELHGKPLVLRVGTEVRKDTGDETNRIKGYKAPSGPVPPPAARPTPAPASGPSTPPWRKA